MIQTNRSQLVSRKLMVLVLGALLLLLQGNARSPVAPPIEGEWEVRCHPPSDDCPDFNVSFDAQGGIVELDLWGENSRESGFGRITGDQIEINIHNIFIFNGQFRSKGHQAAGSLKGRDTWKEKDNPRKRRRRFPAIAQGLLDDRDYDGDDVLTPATVRRVGPRRRPRSEGFDDDRELR